MNQACWPSHGSMLQSEFVIREKARLCDPCVFNVCHGGGNDQRARAKISIPPRHKPSNILSIEDESEPVQLTMAEDLDNSGSKGERNLFPLARAHVAVTFLIRELISPLCANIWNG